MPVYICLEDLSLPVINNDDSLDIQRHGSSSTSDASIAKQLKLGALATLAHAENNKNSYSLQRPYALVSKTYNNDEEAYECAMDEDETDNIDGLKEEIFAIASITACSLPNEIANNSTSCDLLSYIGSHQTMLCKRSTFLFSGLELVSNATYLDLHVSHFENGKSEIQSSSNVATRNEESVHWSDMQSVVSSNPLPAYIDGSLTKPAEPRTKSVADESKFTYRKYRYMMPGGPVPVEKIVLKLKSTNANGSVILLDQLNLTACPLLEDHVCSSDSLSFSSSNTARSSSRDEGNQNKKETRLGNYNSSEKKTLSSHLRSEMATLHHLDPRHLHIRDQADIISRIPGVSLFIRPYEELTTTNIESMLGSMEARILDRMNVILDRLDGLEMRLNAIEKQLSLDDEFQDEDPASRIGA